MGLLAYDPERVALLRQHLTVAVDELRAIRCDDPDTAGAMRQVARIRTEIDLLWLPLLTRILESTALTEQWWRPLSGASLEHSLVSVMADGYGWAVQRDQRSDDADRVTPAEARALGAMFNTADLVRLVDDRAELQWLAHQLMIIGSDADLSANFLCNFAAWPALTYTLGQEHAKTSGSDIAAIFDGLMSIWAHTLPTTTLAAGESATLAALLPAIRDCDLYVQALMLRSLRPEPLTLAAVAHELLRKWIAAKRNPGAPMALDRRIGPGLNSGDILLPLLLGDPAACVLFTTLAANDPAVLFETLNDPDVAYQVLLIGTDPINTTAAHAEVVVLATLEYFRGNLSPQAAFDTDGHAGDYGQFLGSLVAPWLLQFTMINDEWSAAPGTKASLLRVALDDEPAMMRLIAEADRVRTGFNVSLSAGDLNAAHQVGALLNLLLQLGVNEQVDDEMSSNDDRLNLLWTVVGAASSFLPGGPLVGIASGIALTALSNKVAEYLDQPDPTGVRRTAERTMDLALTLAGADAIARLHQSWVANGEVASSHPPPPKVLLAGDDSWCPSAAYHIDFEHWLDKVPGGRDGSLGRGAIDLLNAFVGRSGAQSNCAEIAG